MFDFAIPKKPFHESNWMLINALGLVKMFMSLLNITSGVDRDKEHSTIIYESPQPDTPLLRLGWNKQDPRYMATLLMDSSKVVVLDIRCECWKSMLVAVSTASKSPLRNASAHSCFCCHMLILQSHACHMHDVSAAADNVLA